MRRSRILQEQNLRPHDRHFKTFQVLGIPLCSSTPVGTHGIYHLPFPQSEIRMEKYGLFKRRSQRKKKLSKFYFSLY